MYLERLTAITNSTGDPLRLKIAARQIAADFDRTESEVFDDLMMMRRILCVEAFRGAA